MKKLLIIVAHPDIDHSVINKRWIEELKKYPEQYTVHELYKNYPDGKINREKEQALIEAHDSLILQFPIYWFSCPHLLKKWLDNVLTYGLEGKKFQNKKMGLAVSLGGSESDYTGSFTLAHDLQLFEITARHINASYLGIFSLYDANTEPNKATITTAQIEQSCKDYIEFLSQF